ncbi:hypothetical protein [Xanthomonas cannabis]|uniref:hypothetical protein n=1 Tax=Xanthomonas cannabis TaxID=1885674 RepID=UPI00141B3076|nr:hypothetical protein [Xanthomonas cannabis]NIK63494.1 hypothetical protein [Xanthomonas cannabis]
MLPLLNCYCQIAELYPDPTKNLFAQKGALRKFPRNRIAAKETERVLVKQQSPLGLKEIQDTVEKAIFAAARGKRWQFDAPV